MITAALSELRFSLSFTMRSLDIFFINLALPKAFFALFSNTENKNREII